MQRISNANAQNHINVNIKPKANINIKTLLEEVNLLIIQRCISTLLVIFIIVSEIRKKSFSYYTSDEAI